MSTNSDIQRSVNSQAWAKVPIDSNTEIKPIQMGVGGLVIPSKNGKKYRVVVQYNHKGPVTTDQADRVRQIAEKITNIALPALAKAAAARSVDPTQLILHLKGDTKEFRTIIPQGVDAEGRRDPIINSEDIACTIPVEGQEGMTPGRSPRSVGTVSDAMKEIASQVLNALNPTTRVTEESDLPESEPYISFEGNRHVGKPQSAERVIDLDESEGGDQRFGGLPEAMIEAPVDPILEPSTVADDESNEDFSILARQMRGAKQALKEQRKPQEEGQQTYESRPLPASEMTELQDFKAQHGISQVPQPSLKSTSLSDALKDQSSRGLFAEEHIQGRGYQKPITRNSEFESEWMVNNGGQDVYWGQDKARDSFAGLARRETYRKSEKLDELRFARSQGDSQRGGIDSVESSRLRDQIMAETSNRRDLATNMKSARHVRNTAELQSQDATLGVFTDAEQLHREHDTLDTDIRNATARQAARDEEYLEQPVSPRSYSHKQHHPDTVRTSSAPFAIQGPLAKENRQGSIKDLSFSSDTSSNSKTVEELAREGTFWASEESEEDTGSLAEQRLADSARRRAKTDEFRNSRRFSTDSSAGSIASARILEGVDAMDRATRSNQAQIAALKLRRLEATIERDANADLTDKAVAEAARLEQEENRLAEQFAQVSARYRTQTKVPFTAMVDAMAAYPKRKVVEQESESLPLSAQTLPQEVGDGKITQRTAADLAYQELAAKVRGSNNLSNSQPIAENVSKNAPVSKVDMQQFVQNRDQDLMIILQEISDDES